MAKYIVDEEVAVKTISEWGSGELTQAIMRDIFSKSKKLITCEKCDFSSSCLTPELQKSFINCNYYRTYMTRSHFCGHGEEKDYAPESCD